MLPRKPPCAFLRALAILCVSVVTSLSQDIPLQTKFLEGVEQPPTITKQPPKVYFVDPTDDIHIDCEAKGNPAPSFAWTKDGEHFDPGLDPNIALTNNNSGSFKVQKSNGVLNKKYEGDYQCIVSNAVGKALSEKIRLRLASTPKWPKEVLEPKRVDEGRSVVLPCNPPFGLPPPIIYWMTSTLDHIRQDRRVTQGLNGDLYFANVISSDSREDYTCYAQFKASRTIIQKEPIKLQVNPLAVHNDSLATNVDGKQLGGGRLQSRPARMLTPLGKSSSKHALRGDDLLLECIAEGLPTPYITWRKLDGSLPQGTLSLENFNKTLRISPVSLRNAGQYECTASNPQGTDKHVFDVTIDAAPYWTSKPEGKTVVPGDDANLYCEADGKPKPKIQWLINGVPVEEVPHNPNRIVRGDLVTLKRLPIGGSAVYQCQATNKHGSSLANVFVNVLAVAPLIQTENNKVYEVVENKAIALECKAFGSPKPVMQWSKEKNENVVYANGNLFIQRTTKRDQGLYTCTATNELNSTSIQANLIVRDATRIEPMASLRVERLKDARFVCNVSSDENLSLNVSWEKDGAAPIVSSRVAVDGGVLTIEDVTEEDGGVYTCFAETSLDRHSASASLTVLDRPAAPAQLTLSDLGDRSVELQWAPGDSHNSPVSGVTVQFEEDKHRPGDWQTLDNFTGDVSSAKLQLRPYVNYRFRLIAHNELGPSNASEPSERYFTPPSTPDIAPFGVKAEGTDPDKMTISWKPLDALDSNGPDLQYKVSLRQKGSGDDWREEMVGGNESHYVLAGTPPFTPYEVKVQAVNNQGKGPEPLVIVGFSGEAVPRTAPKNVMYKVVNSTVIRVSWEPLRQEDVLGRLQGYKIYYSKVRGLQERRRRHTGKKVLEFHGARNFTMLPGLEPFSAYSVEVAAFNSKGEGPSSHPIIANTPEGVPGKVVGLQVSQTTLNSVTLEWKPPAERNGILTGYTLTYEYINSTTQELGPSKTENIPANVTSWQVTELEPQSKYKFHVVAQTNAGSGIVITEEAHTVMDVGDFNRAVQTGMAAPKPPSLQRGSHIVGKNFANISWLPSDGQEQYVVQYQKKNGDDDDWKNSSTLDSSTNFFVLEDLQPGTTYNIRVIARNDYGHTVSEEDFVETIGTAYPTRSVDLATQAWFIALLCLIALLILILLIICFIKRNKGGKYSVKDKEDARADPDIKPTKEDTFGEYSDNDEKPLAASMPSLNGSVPHGESEDSLAQYGDGVEGMFNEDGSFIGQYRGSKERVSSTADGGPAAPPLPPPGGSAATSPVAPTA
ncbi:neuronal cell adhesion molecule-like isoform X2 [Lampetra fluviatilis]